MRKWLRQDSKDLYGSGFDAPVKRWNKCMNDGRGRIFQEINVFSRFEYHMFYVLYPFVAYLLTLPRTWLCKLNIRISPRLFKHHEMKRVEEMRDLCILNLGTRWRWVSSLLYGHFTPRKFPANTGLGNLEIVLPFSVYNYRWWSSCIGGPLPGPRETSRCTQAENVAAWWLAELSCQLLKQDIQQLLPPIRDMPEYLEFPQQVPWDHNIDILIKLSSLLTIHPESFIFHGYHFVTPPRRPRHSSGG
jgi:hypothetical protein